MKKKLSERDSNLQPRFKNGLSITVKVVTAPHRQQKDRCEKMTRENEKICIGKKIKKSEGELAALKLQDIEFVRVIGII